MLAHDLLDLRVMIHLQQGSRLACDDTCDDLLDLRAMIWCIIYGVWLARLACDDTFASHRLASCPMSYVLHTSYPTHVYPIHL